MAKSGGFKQPFVLADGTVQILGVSSNITDLKRTQQELRTAKEAAEANARAKQEFLANMSHEIRTPMNGILGIANLLAKTPLDEQQGEYLGHIQHSAESLLVVINDVLDMAQLDAGKIIPENTPFDLREVLRAGQQLIRPRAAEKRRGPGPGPAPRARADHRARRPLPPAANFAQPAQQRR